MKLSERLAALTTAIGGDIKVLLGRVGNLTALTTIEKGNLVGAINEVKAAIPAAGAGINDAAASTTSTYSSTKIEARVTERFSEFVGAAPTTLDTWAELVSSIQGNSSAAAAMTTAISVRVAVDAVQNFNATQQAQGRANIAAFGEPEIGNPDLDLVAAYTAAKA